MVKRRPSDLGSAEGSGQDPVASAPELMVLGKPQPLIIGPAPGERDLILEIECRTSPDATSGKVHEVTIHADWTLTTPHDLEAERVAQAFGAYTSCLQLQDVTIPALRAAIEVVTRHQRPALRRNKRGQWLLPAGAARAGCCERKTYGAIAKAFRHLVSPEHVARQADVPLWQLQPLLEAAEAAWLSVDVIPSRRRAQLRSMVRETGGVLELWRAGIRPEEVADMAALTHCEEALPLAYFLGLAYGTTDPTWLSEVMQHRPDPDVAAWLVGMEEPHAEFAASMLGPWLAFGLPRAETVALATAQVSPDLPHQIAAATGWTVHQAARSLASWTGAGCSPSIDDFRVLARYEIRRSPIHARALEELYDELVRSFRTGFWADDPTVQPTEVALLLAVLGNRTEVRGAIAAGVVTLHDLDAHLAGKESA